MATDPGVGLGNPPRLATVPGDSGGPPPGAFREGLTRRLRDVSARIIEAKGGTAFGPAGATVELIHALIGSRPRVVPCSVVLDGEYGVHDVAIGVPAVLGTGRVLGLEEWPLAEDEQAAFEEAARDLKAFADDAAVLLKVGERPSG